jgi:hypothetical protein
MTNFRFTLPPPEAPGATTFLEIPDEIVTSFGSGRRPPVKVTINGFTYRTTIAVYGGKSYVPVRRKVREGARITYHEPLDVSIELDHEPRTVHLPDDFSGALAADPMVRTAFDKLSYTHRKEYVDWITGAKRGETRRRRVEQTLAMLRDGRRTPK